VPLADPIRARLAVIAEALIPGAGETDTTGRWLDRVLAADPDRLPALEALAARPEPDGWAAAAALYRADAVTFEYAVDGLVAAYHMHPGVRRRLGYPGQKATPSLEGEAEHYLPDGALDHVRARGPIYVPTPDA
jgi:hypothetical protein